MVFSKERYKQLVERASPPSPLGKDCLLAFLFGGGLCAGAQGVCVLYQAWGLSLPQARTAVSLSLIFLSALLTALGWYDQIAKYAGAGTLVPITGFANSVVSPAMEFKTEGLVTGLGAKLFTVAGPVLVFGVTASVVYGLALVLLQALGVPLCGPWAGVCGSSPCRPGSCPKVRWGAAGRPAGLWGASWTRPSRTPAWGKSPGSRPRPPCKGRPSPWPCTKLAWPRRIWTWCWPGTC